MILLKTGQLFKDNLTINYYGKHALVFGKITIVKEWTNNLYELLIEEDLSPIFGFKFNHVLAERHTIYKRAWESRMLSNI